MGLGRRVRFQAATLRLFSAFTGLTVIFFCVFFVFIVEL
jgi:hypothetical protein